MLHLYSKALIFFFKGCEINGQSTEITLCSQHMINVSSTVYNMHLNAKYLTVEGQTTQQNEGGHLASNQQLYYTALRLKSEQQII